MASIFVLSPYMRFEHCAERCRFASSVLDAKFEEIRPFDQSIVDEALFLLPLNHCCPARY